jgi:hypothetical protein
MAVRAQGERPSMRSDLSSLSAANTGIVAAKAYQTAAWPTTEK